MSNQQQQGPPFRPPTQASGSAYASKAVAIPTGRTQQHAVPAHRPPHGHVVGHNPVASPPSQAPGVSLAGLQSMAYRPPPSANMGHIVSPAAATLMLGSAYGPPHILGATPPGYVQFPGTSPQYGVVPQIHPTQHAMPATLLPGQQPPTHYSQQHQLQYMTQQQPAAVATAGIPTPQASGVAHHHQQQPPLPHHQQQAAWQQQAALQQQLQHQHQSQGATATGHLWPPPPQQLQHQHQPQGATGHCQPSPPQQHQQHHQQQQHQKTPQPPSSGESSAQPTPGRSTVQHRRPSHTVTLKNPDTGKDLTDEDTSCYACRLLALDDFYFTTNEVLRPSAKPQMPHQPTGAQSAMPAYYYPGFPAYVAPSNALSGGMAVTAATVASTSGVKPMRTSGARSKTDPPATGMRRSSSSSSSDAFAAKATVVRTSESAEGSAAKSITAASVVSDKPSTEASAGKSAEVLAAKSAEASVAKSAEASAAKSAEASAAKSAEASAAKSAEASAAKSAEASAAKSAEASAAKSAEASAAKSAEASAAKSAEAPAAKSAEAPAAKSAEAPAAKSAEAPDAKSAEAPAAKSAVAPAAKSAEAPAAKYAEAPAAKSAEAPAEKSAGVANAKPAYTSVASDAVVPTVKSARAQASKPSKALAAKSARKSKSDEAMGAKTRVRRATTQTTSTDPRQMSSPIGGAALYARGAPRRAVVAGKKNMQSDVKPGFLPPSPSPATAGATTSDAATHEERSTQQSPDQSPAGSPADSPEPMAKVSKGKSARSFRYRELPDSDPLTGYKDKPAREEAKPESKTGAKKTKQQQRPAPEQQQRPAPEQQQRPASEPTWDEKDDRELVADLPTSLHGSVASAEPVQSDSKTTKPGTPSDEKKTFKTAVPGIRYPDEDMWRPDNPEGRKSYDGSFLRQFSGYADPPANLPVGVEILRSPNPQSHQSGASSVPPPPSQGGRGSSGGRQGRTSRSSVSSQSSRKTVTLQMDTTAAEPLQKSSNRWKPTREKKTDDSSDAETQAVISRMMTILNKLTPEKFERLATAIDELEINSEERLRGVVELIYKKSLSEPTYCELYARICLRLADLEVPFDGDEALSFRRVLLTKCQREYESTDPALADLEKKHLSNADKLSSEDLKQKTAEYESEVSVLKKNSLGNIKFIGELFKLKLLTETIMHRCLMKLLAAGDDDSLELMCKLFGTTGRLLDRERAKARIDQYFDKIKRIIKKEPGKTGVSTRIRFMLEDLVSQRRRAWAARREDNKPKKLNEVHQEAKAAENAAAAAAAMPRSSSSRSERSSAHGGSRSHSGRNTNAEGDGWQTALPRQRSEPDRLRGTSQRAALSHRTDDTRSSGPSGRSSGGQGSMGGTSRSAPRDVERGNRYASLAAADPVRSPEQRVNGNSTASSRRTGSTSSSHGSAATHSSANRTSCKEQVVSGGPLPPGPPRDVRKEIPDLDRSLIMPGGALAVSQAAITAMNSDTAPAVAEVEKKARVLTEDFFSNPEAGEVRLCIADINSPISHPAIVSTMITCALEMKDTQCKLVADLFTELVPDGTIKLECIVAGLYRVLEETPDLALDIPHIYDLLVIVIVPLVFNCKLKIFTLSELVVKHLRDVGKAAVFMVKVLKAIAEKKGEFVARQLCGTAYLKWSSLLQDGQNVDQFLADQGVQFLDCPSLPYFLEDRYNRPRGRDVKDWIDRTYQDTTTASFAEDCASRIACAFIDPTTREFANAKCETLLILGISRYFEHDPDLRYAVILGLEKVAAQYDHHPGMLQSLFDAFYSGDACDDGAFFKWEAMATPTGGDCLHGVALNSVKQFLAFLHSEYPDQ